MLGEEECSHSGGEQLDLAGLNTASTASQLPVGFLWASCSPPGAPGLQQPGIFSPSAPDAKDRRIQSGLQVVLLIWEGGKKDEIIESVWKTMLGYYWTELPATYEPLAFLHTWCYVSEASGRLKVKDWRS